MAMGTRQQRQRQEELWVATAALARPTSHPFYERLNRLLDECHFDEFVESLCERFWMLDFCVMADCEQTGLRRVTSGRGETPLHLPAVYLHTSVQS